ncbi:MAG: hypothetical protein Q8S19_06530 [Bacillota bacterium]|nr:hypothetical protein [Bacillota bacterium]
MITARRATPQRQAVITVAFSGVTESFGTTNQWEASLYKGAVPGQETEGRFTEWKEAQNATVRVTLPDDVRPGLEAPWDEPRNTYVRIRTLNGYPTFDFVGRPFTLRPLEYRVHMALRSVVRRVQVQGAQVRAKKRLRR